VTVPATGTTPDRDPGLFGPDSVTWRVHGDPIMWLAGLRALLLQALHPAAMAGVLEHSDFRADPWGRLFRTADYVGVVSFGSTAEVAAIGRRVRGIHRTVSGVDPETGVRYSATDPELLRWVHCSEVESFLTTYLRAGGRLGAADVDAYYAEQTRAAAVVGLDPAEVPATAAAMAAYFESMRPALGADARTRALARYVVAPPLPARMRWTTPARPAWAAGASVAVGLLPGWARRLYGLPPIPLAGATAAGSVRALRTATTLAPKRFREGPHLRAAKARLGV
jgi:uncharacterized protein (DUF2236 family)